VSSGAGSTSRTEGASAVHRNCPLCEATCGITVWHRDGQVVDLRGDPDDPFSRGYICPKAHALRELQTDGDRLRLPLLRRGRDFEEIGWDQALELAVERLSRVRAEHGPDAVATYLGNPVAHSLHAMVYGPILLRALGTRNRFSASSADQLPKMLSAGLMFGAGLTIPVPDLDRTEYLVVLGGNPRVSNGSLMTAPDVGRRLDAIRARGGQVVVVDPRRSETAARASEHLFIRPGTDAAWLLALVHVLFAEGRVRLGRAEGLVRGLDQVERAVADLSPERVAAFTGIAPEVTRRIARQLSDGRPAACYGRIGTTCQRFGSLASWAVDLVNILGGNLDREGGAMFTRPAANRGANRAPDRSGGRGVHASERRSRARGLPYWFGELPVAGLADEILTAGPGQVRGLLTVAGNPLLSAPGADRLQEAFASLDTLVAVDFYLNETTRLAHLILPPPAPLEKNSYDLALYQLSIRNVAKYSPAVLPRPDGQPAEWEILATLAKGFLGAGAMPLGDADDLMLAQLVEGEIGPDGGAWPGLTAAEAIEKLGKVPGPERVLDLLLRVGPWGDGFGRRPGGLTLRALRAAPHGVDLGPLLPELPGVLRTPDALIDLAPPLLLDEVPRLRAALDEPPAQLVLIGRRQLRSNNSWMHNLPSLAKGKPRCTLLVHPDDAQARGLGDGDRAEVQSAAGTLQADVQLTAEMMPGVVSLPHGFGHDADGARLEVARGIAGVNVNRLSDPALVDLPSGNAAFNGVPVTLRRA
jgi:anaerobic selenocysteine-containing dehydrogenase